MKRTVYNCKMHKIAERELVGHAAIIDGKCEGYANCGEEPHDVCKECKLATHYGDTHDNKEVTS